MVMSATMDSGQVARYLGNCPIVDVAGRTFPVEVVYCPGVGPEAAVVEALPTAGGAVLCFLPGTREIARAADAIRSRCGPATSVHQLHGGLTSEEQDAALRPSRADRVILATNLAETTLTVPDVRVVVDSGLHKVARYDADRGLDSLDTERVSTDSADQRAGRAGRVASGRAIRLWDARDRLRAHREPDIARVDLAATVTEIIAWGGNPRAFPWFETPPDWALDHALRLLRALGAIDESDRLTELGRALRTLPLHPRLGRLLLDAGGTVEAARACAILSERHFLPPRLGATSCDLLSAVEGVRDLPPHLLRVARDVRESALRLLGSRSARHDEVRFRRAVLAAFPDRVARRREPGRDRVLLASGTGARIGRESGVVGAEFLVAVDVSGADPHSPSAEHVVRIATGIEKAWLSASTTEIQHRLDSSTGRVRAVEVSYVGQIVLGERDAAVDPVERQRLIADAIVSRGPSDEDAQLIRRLGVAGHHIAFEALVQSASAAATCFADVDLAAALPHNLRQALDRHAPAALALPSGRSARLTYWPDGRITAAVKLQELFGLGDTPRVGPARTPVTFELLSPAGRPVQVTSDLRSFWTSGYLEVRRELGARYPKHPWPEDPWTATPTHRTARRKV